MFYSEIIENPDYCESVASEDDDRWSTMVVWDGMPSDDDADQDSNFFGIPDLIFYPEETVPPVKKSGPFKSTLTRIKKVLTKL